MASHSVNGTTFAYSDEGTGRPIVLLHSSAASGGQWRAYRQGLIDAGFRVLAPDLYGYGGTPAWSGRGRLRLADEAALVEALLDLCGEPVDLVGHSYGGAVALHVARHHGTRLRSLALIEPVAFHLLWNSDPWAARYFAEIRELADAVWAAMSNGDYRGTMARFTDYWSGEGAWSRLTERQRAAIAAAAPKVALDFWATITEPTTLDDLTEISVPTLLVAGGRSPAPARRIVDLIETALPRARLKVVPDAGHMLPLTHAEVVARLLTEHLLPASEEPRAAA
jgi:pimeloyl-ACP methyl ester carboxylesterase